MKMLEILKRFEESNLEDEGMFEDGDEQVDDDDDFENRLQGIDIGTSPCSPFGAEFLQTV